MRYVLEFAYKGTDYAGWQIQPNAVTVQEILDQTLQVIFSAPIQTLGAGRTDAGVHASQMFAHFDSEAPLPERFLYRLNGILPKDIAVKAVYQPVRDNFHARFDAIRRSYIYRMTQVKDPFQEEWVIQLSQPLDHAAMQEAAGALFEYEDFASFCKANGEQKTTRCTIFQSEWQFDKEGFSYHVAANRFLRGMVRALVGSMLLVGKGKLDPAGFRRMIEAKDRRQAGPNAGAKGLTLVEVAYKEGELIRIL